MLVSKISGLVGSITHINLLFSGTGKPWTKFGIANLLTGENLEPQQDLSAEQLARAVLDRCEAYGSENGVSHFKVQVFVREGTGTKRKEICRVEYTFRIGDALPDTRDGEMIAMVREAREWAKQAAAMHLKMAEQSVETVKAFVGIQTGVAEVVQANSGNAQALVDLTRLKYEHEAAMEEAKLDQERLFRGIDLLETVATQYFAGEGGAKPTPGKESIPAQLDGILKSLNPEETKKVKEALGDDAWSLFLGAAKTNTNDECKAVLAKLKELWSELDKEEGGAILKKVGEIIGPQRFMQLVMVLKKAGIA